MAGFSILQEAAIPFNGSGSFSLAEPAFVPLTTISSASMNSDLSDIADGLSNCLTTDGQSSMSAQIKGVAGSVVAPSYSFSTDLNTGIYRVAADTLGVSAGGTKILDVSNTGLNVIGSIKQNGVALLPPGLGPLPWAGSTAPDGWLLCYGQSLLRASYPDLFAAIGTAWGAADGTHFNVPDMRGYVPAGRDDMGGAAAGRLTSTTMTPNGTTLAAIGGAQTVTIAQANLPAVTLATSIASGQGSHAHTITTSSNGSPVDPSQVSYSGGGSVFQPATSAATLPAMTGTTPLGGSGTAVDKIQPTIITNYIIFAGV